MGLFKKKNPQDAFDPDVFTITDTILDPPRFTFLPAIYQDATRRKWPCISAAASRRFLTMRTCCSAKWPRRAIRRPRKWSQNRNLPSVSCKSCQAAKINAAKRNMCLGMGVVVAVQTGKDEVSKLEIPVMTDEVKRNSSLYKSYRIVAEKIKAEFDAMGGLV